MSVNLAPNNLKDQDCEKGKITVRPPIGYVQFKYKQWVTAPQRIKLKLTEDNQFSCNLMDDSSNSETYLKWLLVFICVKDEKKLNLTLEVAAEALTKVQEDVRKHSKIPKRESVESKAECKLELELVAANTRPAEAKVKHGSAIGACYNLPPQLLADKPQVQWDWIVSDVHYKDTWMGLNGMEHKGLHMKISKTLEDCIMFHKLTVFHCDASEWQKACMMGSLRKPFSMTVQNYGSRCGTLNRYITMLLTLRESA